MTAQETDKKRVLVVDDSRTIRTVIRKILQSNYDVYEATDGEFGWQKLLENPDTSLVVSDIMMPNLDGYGFLCRIRAAEQPSIQQVPVLVVTSSSDEITRERAHACGANDFIVKPVEASDLLKRVHFHTESQLSDEDRTDLPMNQFEELETTVVETPDINQALEVINGAKEGVITPYAIDLCLEVLPLLEYCEENFALDIKPEIDRIKEQLKKQAI